MTHPVSAAALQSFAVPGEVDELLLALTRARAAVRSLEASAALDALEALERRGHHEGVLVAPALRGVLESTSVSRTRLLKTSRMAAWLRAIRRWTAGDADAWGLVALGSSLAIDALRMDRRSGTVEVLTDGAGSLWLLSGPCRLVVDARQPYTFTSIAVDGEALRWTTQGDEIEIAPTSAQVDGRLAVVPDDELVNRTFVAHEVDAAMSSVTRDRWTTFCWEVESWLRDAGGPWSELINLQIEYVIPVVPSRPDRFVSGTSNSAPGAVAASLPPTVAQFGETLVHEQQHTRLDLLLDVIPLLREANRPVRLVSPWREDLRPPSGVLHGIVAFAGVAAYWDGLSGTGDDAQPSAAAEAARRARQVMEASATLSATGLLTAEGDAVIEGVVTCMADVVGKLACDARPIKTGS